MTLPDLLLPTYRQMLTAFSTWLGKAEGDAVLSARLAGDMFPLATQVCFACVQALEGTSRISGREIPPEVADLLEQGRNADAAPGTLAEARERIERTLAQLDRIAVEAEWLSDDAPIAHAIPAGMIFDLTALQYARDWALPQFYFHLMAGYAILRGEGVALGKIDYVAHMLPFVRPGTMPQC